MLGEEKRLRGCGDVGRGLGVLQTAVCYAVLTALLLLGQGVSGMGGEEVKNGAHSFSHDANLTDLKRGQSLRRLLQASDGIRIPPKMYGGEIR